MEIASRQAAEGVELVLSGRLDAYWSDHLSKALDEAVRGGMHRLRLDMSDVPYMSSVGIRVLLHFFKETQRLGGSFQVVRASDAVRRVLELAGLESLLGGGAAAEAPAARFASRTLERETAVFEIFDLPAAAPMRCRIVGRPESLEGCRYTQSQTVRFPASTIGVGLGGFGSGFDDCRERFGEFVAVAGAPACLPTDGTGTPDVVVATRDLVPEVQVLYALACEGDFASLARFEARPDETVTLSELVDESLALVATGSAAIVIVAETAGLMGAALRRSPALAAADAPFAFPQIREWLSFTPERAFPRSLAVIAGIANRDGNAALAPFVRPIAAATGPSGHFHACALSYRALPKGALELAPTVASLFSEETLQGLLHLLGDDRPSAGAGQSEFVRGACWVAPLARIDGEEGA